MIPNHHKYVLKHKRNISYSSADVFLLHQSLQDSKKAPTHSQAFLHKKSPQILRKDFAITMPPKFAPGKQQAKEGLEQTVISMYKPPQYAPGKEQAKDDLEQAVANFFYYTDFIPVKSIQDEKLGPMVVSSENCMNALEVILDHSKFSEKPYKGRIVKVYTPGLEEFFFYLDATRLSDYAARFEFKNGEKTPVKYSMLAERVESNGQWMGHLGNLLAKLSVYLRCVDGW